MDNSPKKENYSVLADPTDKTTQALLHEIESLKELIFIRLGAMDKATDLINDNLTRVPTELQKEVSHLKELLTTKIHDNCLIKEEKLKAIDQRFELMEKIRLEQKSDTITVFISALDTLKQSIGQHNESSSLAISKSEASTTKQIDQQSALIYSTTKALDEKINDGKDRLTRIEGLDLGKKGAKEDNFSLWAILIAAAAGIMGLISILSKSGG